MDYIERWDYAMLKKEQMFLHSEFECLWNGKTKLSMIANRWRNKSCYSPSLRPWSACTPGCCAGILTALNPKVSRAQHFLVHHKAKSIKAKYFWQYTVCSPISSTCMVSLKALHPSMVMPEQRSQVNLRSGRMARHYITTKQPRCISDWVAATWTKSAYGLQTRWFAENKP